MQGRLLRRDCYYARMPKVKCYFVGEYAAILFWVLDDTSDDTAFEATAYRQCMGAIRVRGCVVKGRI